MHGLPPPTIHVGPCWSARKRSLQIATDRREFSVFQLTTQNPSIELHPGDTALLYSQENLRLPTFVLGFTVSRGLLFAEALSPENTYVDPGFMGHLYTTVTNLSNRVVRLESGLPR